VEYLFNRDVLFSRVIPMIRESRTPGFQGGITGFDEYSDWMGDGYHFGPQTVLPGGVPPGEPAEEIPLTEEEAERIRTNIRQNVTALADANPGITFYCFIPPYSAAWWQAWLAAGQLDKKVDAERIVIEEILGHENIRLFSFNCLFEITTDLNHYKDMDHYGGWINSLMLRWMAEGKYQLTRENYLEYLETERTFYRDYDYTLLMLREDYAEDERAAEILNRELTGEEP